jgi:hypothetical protein
VVKAAGAEAVLGDLDAVPALQLGMQGCDCVLHAAAHTEEWDSDEAFWKHNVVGTDNVLTAARAAKVKRFVQISSEAAMADGRPLIRLDETRPLPAKPLPGYPFTKAESERRVLAANGPELETVVVRPRILRDFDSMHTEWRPRYIRECPSRPATRAADRRQFGQIRWRDGIGGHIGRRQAFAGFAAQKLLPVKRDIAGQRIGGLQIGQQTVDLRDLQRRIDDFERGVIGVSCQFRRDGNIVEGRAGRGREFRDPADRAEVIHFEPEIVRGAFDNRHDHADGHDAARRRKPIRLGAELRFAGR